MFDQFLSQFYRAETILKNASALEKSCDCRSASGVTLNNMINPLWSADTIRWQRSRSTLVQVMACCLVAPSHYLNQCWLLVSDVLCHSPESNFTVLRLQFCIISLNIIPLNYCHIFQGPLSHRIGQFHTRNVQNFVVFSWAGKNDLLIQINTSLKCGYFFFYYKMYKTCK